ncbi:MAG: ribosome maturation factor RimM [Candidatus Eisenbacteria bacterium]
MKQLDDWIEAGAITRPHGIKGEVVVDLARDLLEVVTESLELRVTGRGGGESILTVERARDHKARKIVKFEDVETVEDANALRGSTVWLTREQIGPLAEDRWFVADIVGIDVYTDEDEYLGKLAEVMHMPANDVYVVRDGEKEILLPVIDEVVKSVDLDSGRMVIHLMEGLA